jgi:hypothetical protein
MAASDVGMKPERSVYDVALLLGIGAMTVCQDERAALAKLCTLFERLQVSRVGQLDHIEPELFRDTLREFGLGPEQKARQYPLSPPWFRVSRIISVSGGSERVRDVVLTHQFLNERDPGTFRPPVFTRIGRMTRKIGSVGRAVEFEGAMRMQLHSMRLQKHRVHPRSEFTVLVESEFGRDSGGEFEVPVIVAAFAAAPISSRREWNGECQVGGARVN